eukprot:COSAG06_NODE_12325_length_1395_cov_1.211420_1_plen_72_part_00
MVPYDGGSYDSVIAVPGRPDTLLLTYAVSSSPFEMKIMGMFVSVVRKAAADVVTGSSSSGRGSGNKSSTTL